MRGFDVLNMAVLWALTCYLAVVAGLGQKSIISFEKVNGGLELASEGQTAGLVVDGNDWPGVIRAANDLSKDFDRVTGHALPLLFYNSSATSFKPSSKLAILVGTIGNSSIIDGLIKSKKIDVSKTAGKWESFQTQLVSSPLPGISSALVIAGSDKRGTIFGIYTISEQIGVSPWYFWADVPPAQKSSIYAIDTVFFQGPPSVKYRGIFLNDEQPALTNWVNDNFPRGEYGPGYNHELYVLVFELLLRLKANFLWPTMWDSMFGVDDSKNQETADMFGIVMSTSHTEPLQRSTKEWNTFGNGTWSYATNSENIYPYWVEGVERGKPYENVWTMGMRGNGDTALSSGVATDLLEKVIADQRTILKDVLRKDDLLTVPQVWCLYKDIQAYYEAGMRVPDDITLLWTDDNWGNMRRLPLANETARIGGAGVYYHFDYVGDPRDYKWINTIQLQKVWEQMHLAYERQARQIWVVNVGDLKPLEIPIDYFLSLAYDFDVWGPVNTVNDWELAWATREFGSAYADQIAEIIDTYGLYAGRRKYELVDPNTYSTINYREADTILSDWGKLFEKAEAVYNELPSSAKPAFFQLVMHPVKAGYIVYDIHISSARNNLYASQRRNSANTLAEHVLQRFKDDHKLTQEYHALLSGKWNHMMDQTHLGYDYWQQPMRNTLPPLSWTQLFDNSLAGSLGVAVESSNGSVPGDDLYNSAAYGNNTLVLPQLDPYSIPSSRWIEIFAKGPEAFTFTITPHNAWVIATPATGFIDPSTNATDVRVEISIDWDSAPNGYNIAFIDITSSASYGNFAAPSVNIPINKTSIPEDLDFHGFLESNQHISIEASHFTRNITSSSAYYQLLPGHGRILSGMTLFPVLAPSQSVTNGPRLEYDLFLFTDPQYPVNVTLYLSAALNQDPQRPLKYGIAFDDAEPQVVQFIPDAKPLDMPAGWTKAVSDSVWTCVTSHVSEGTGIRTLKVWALEPGVVVQKIVVDLGGVSPSYLGPPETMRV